VELIRPPGHRKIVHVLPCAQGLAGLSADHAIYAVAGKILTIEQRLDRHGITKRKLGNYGRLLNRWRRWWCTLSLCAESNGRLFGLRWNRGTAGRCKENRQNPNDVPGFRVQGSDLRVQIHFPCTMGTNTTAGLLLLFPLFRPSCGEGRAVDILRQRARLSAHHRGAGLPSTGGIFSGAQVTMIASNGANIGQPL